MVHVTVSGEAAAPAVAVNAGAGCEGGGEQVVQVGGGGEGTRAHGQILPEARRVGHNIFNILEEDLCAGGDAVAVRNMARANAGDSADDVRAVAALVHVVAAGVGEVRAAWRTAAAAAAAAHVARLHGVLQHHAAVVAWGCRRVVVEEAVVEVDAGVSDGDYRGGDVDGGEEKGGAGEVGVAWSVADDAAAAGVEEMSSVLHVHVINRNVTRQQRHGSRQGADAAVDFNKGEVQVHVRTRRPGSLSRRFTAIEPALCDNLNPACAVSARHWHFTLQHLLQTASQLTQRITLLHPCDSREAACFGGKVMSADSEVEAALDVCYDAAAGEGVERNQRAHVAARGERHEELLVAWANT